MAGTIQADTFTNSAGTGAPNFSNGLTASSTQVAQFDKIANSAGTGAPQFTHGFYGNTPSTYVATATTMSSNGTSYSPSAIGATNSSDSSYITSVAISGGGANTTGTWTITFARTGYFLISSLTAVTGGSITTGGTTAITILGGTGTLLYPDTNTYQCNSLNISGDNPSISTGGLTLNINVYVNITSAAQTLTVNTYANSIGNSGAESLRSFIAIQPL